MEFFINEWSFAGQFYDRGSLGTAVAAYVQLVECARCALQERRGRMWRSTHLDERQLLHEQQFNVGLHVLAEREIREAFIDVVFNRANPSPWEPDRKHQSDEYYSWNEDCVTDTSMAELAERQRQDDALRGCLLNLRGSRLSGHACIGVLKEGSEEKIKLWPIETIEQLDQWLERVAQVARYQLDATRPPRDDETCLVDGRFEETHLIASNGRRIYRHKTRGDLYYVDSGHPGRSAELEVFDRRHEHIGTATLDGVVDKKQKVNGRKIKLKG